MTRTSPTAVKWFSIGARPRPARPGLAVAPARGGMTLIELVMVVSLLVLLAAIAIPSVQMAVEGRRVREAARAVNVYLGSARNRAMATGRPVGVALRRFENDENVCFTLDQVEAPPPYAGDTFGARATIAYMGDAPDPADPDDPNNWNYEFQVNMPAGTFSPSAVGKGDQIQFAHQGRWYTILYDPTATSLVCGIRRSQIPSELVDAGVAWPWPNASDGPSDPMPYTIHRQPALPGTAAFHAAVAKPLQLPLDAVVDLTFSGGSRYSVADATVIPSYAFAGGTTPVVIMFSPNGGLDRVYYAGDPVPITEPLHLLIGKRERIPAGIAEDGLSNLQDFENLWISISPRTGLVNTAPMGSVDVGPPTDGDITISDPIYWARRYARLIDSMGGR